MYKSLSLGVLFTGVLLTSCMNDENDAQIKALDSIMSNLEIDTANVSGEVLDQIVKTVPSPLVMSSFLEATGAEFSQDLLHDKGMADDYASAFQMAVNLGVYGADLGYINVYKKNHIAVDYLNAIKRLADGLKVGQFFDIQAMRRMTANRNDIDSLINITTQGFEDMDVYLKERNRDVISALILYGGWVEGTYIACQVIGDMPNPPKDMMERIGEQKLALKSLYDLLSIYKQQPYFAALIEELENLRQAYEGVELITEDAEATMEEVDGVLTVVDHSQSSVRITVDQLREIRTQLTKIRNHITSQVS
ncbi:MAG: hypothetical protein H6585_12385 [Flavobacteriales bacterium]|nr:hypothetical protein [Flavobacteriales bacterium]MCB9449128.1 hypothetical protein [Flavobacteriales bacterium]